MTVDSWAALWIVLLWGSEGAFAGVMLYVAYIYFRSLMVKR